MTNVNPPNDDVNFPGDEYEWQIIPNQEAITIMKPSVSIFVYESPNIPNSITAGEFCYLKSGIIARIISIDIEGESHTLQMQWFKSVSNIPYTLIDDVPTDLETATRGLDELVSTNLVASVSSRDLDRLVFPVCAETALSYSFGVLHHRSCVYFWRYQAEYKVSDNSPVLVSLSNAVTPSEYHDFGPPIRNSKSSETLSEWMMLGLKQFCNRSKAIFLEKG